MPPEDFDQMTEDIRGGLLEPIWLYEGKILDGWHRYRAAKKVGLEPKTREYRGDDPVAFVRSMNIIRRHLSNTEKAIADSLLLTETGKRTRDRTNARARSYAESAHDKKTKTERAREMGIGRRTVARADFIVDYAPETAKAVVNREIGADAAEAIAKRCSKAKTETARAAIEERGIAAAKKPRKSREKKATTPKSQKATSDVAWLIKYLQAWTEVLNKDALVALRQGKFAPEAAAFFARRLRSAFEPVAKEFEEWARDNGMTK
jgi:ParB-like chromosome segregation protein Spo0J